MASICCLMPVSPTASEWAYNNYLMAITLSSKKHKIDWFAACSDPNTNIPLPGFSMLYSGSQVTPVEGFLDCRLEHAACVTHAVNILKEHKDKYDIIVILDSDMFLMYPGWDDKFISILDEYDIFGASYAGMPYHDQYQNFPSINLFVTRSSTFFSKRINFWPVVGPQAEGLARMIIDPDEAMLVGLPMMSRCSLDGPWRLPLIFRRDEYKVYSMPVVRGDSPNAVIKSGPHDMRRGGGFQEFYYQNMLIAIHFQGCRGTSMLSPVAQEWMGQVRLCLDRMQVSTNKCTV